MIDYLTLADLIFPDITKTPQDYLAQYAPRTDIPQNARVTRFAPSPTGFLHIGGLFASLVSERLAHQGGGVFFLRIEDTDKKREVENGVSGIIDGLNAFGIHFDEGMTGQNTEKGAYGPYLQSKRRNIYRAFAKDLMQRGLAYPCFCTEETLSAIREEQEKNKLLPGYYGSFAKCRELSLEEIRQNLDLKKPFVVRLRSQGSPDKKIKFKDGIKGEIEMPQNHIDIVLLKSDGIPTYHFAHAVDDTLMRTTNVVRGDEWISSVPTHIELFSAIGQKCPKYAHIAPIMKESEDGGKRKISKRKDPEAAVSYFVEQGYPAAAVIEYLLNLANYTFEDWRRQNPGTHYNEFPFSLAKMSPSGALFDLIKLNDVSKSYISRLSAQEVVDLVLPWAEKEAPELYKLLIKDPEYTLSIFSIDRGGPKPRKDLAKWNEVPDYISYFFDETFSAVYELPDRVSAEDALAIIQQYRELYSETDDKDSWFAKIKSLCAPFHYSEDTRSYKKDPEKYKGHVGDISNVIRVAITGRQQSPDLCAICRLMGKDRVLARLDRFTNFISEEIK